MFSTTGSADTARGEASTELRVAEDRRQRRFEIERLGVSRFEPGDAAWAPAVSDAQVANARGSDAQVADAKGSDAKGSDAEVANAKNPDAKDPNANLVETNVPGDRLSGPESSMQADLPMQTDQQVAIWERVKRRLRAEVGEDVYTCWLIRLEIEALAGDVVTLTVPTKFLKSWIQSHYADRIAAVFKSEDDRIQGLVIEVRSSAARQALLRPEPAVRPIAGPVQRNVETSGSGAAPVNPKTVQPGTLSGNPLDRRFTFGSFLVGRSNALAHAAARQVAELTAAGTGNDADRKSCAVRAAAPLYNPLYIHAGVGLGKTHLIQAAAHGATKAGRRVIYFTADGFMYGFVASLKAHTALAFKEKLRGIDLLIIDDVQFLQGKSVQQEFCHTINALIDAGKQIIVAADRAPNELESLDERVRSRLAGGLVVEVQGLDEDLRMRILEGRVAAARALHHGFDVTPAVVAHVARRIVTNGRDLDGAVNRLLAHVTLTQTALTIETADIAIRDLIRQPDPKKVKIEDIQKMVAQHFSVTRADILSSRRTANVVRPRQIAMYLSKVLTLRSLPEIGRRFGGRDHTTVLHAVRKVELLVSKDESLRSDVELLKTMLAE